uniref:DUF4939 domain-containing protein n=1 Tax=Xiphophorus maculatus TaxID=8083 RepID=A0A3B5QV56_XIPMA
MERMKKKITPIHPGFSETRPPNPEKYSGEINRCGGFLLQCSLAFNNSPRSFAHDGAKISYIISHLSGRALDWAELMQRSADSLLCSCLTFNTKHHYVVKDERAQQPDADKQDF